MNDADDGESQGLGLEEAILQMERGAQESSLEGRESTSESEKGRGSGAGD